MKSFVLLLLLCSTSTATTTTRRNLRQDIVAPVAPTSESPVVASPVVADVNAPPSVPTTEAPVWALAPIVFALKNDTTDAPVTVAPVAVAPVAVAPVAAPAAPVVTSPVAPAAPVVTTTTTTTTEAPSAVPKKGGDKDKDKKNDLFHCIQALLDGTDLSKADDDSVHCDPESFGWDLALLDPNRPPDRCDDYTPKFEDLLDNNDDDWNEPCVWWHLTYGDLKKSEAPSSVPSMATSNMPSSSTIPSSIPSSMPSVTNLPSQLPTLSTPPSTSIVPSVTPTSLPTETQAPSPFPSTVPTSSIVPTAFPTGTPSLDLMKQPSRVLTDFVLMLTLPIAQRNRQLQGGAHFQMTQDLLQRSETHFHTFMEESLGLSILKVDLDSPAQEYIESSYFLVQTEGIVYFHPDSVVPTTETLDQLIEQSMQGSALDAYLRLLHDSEAATLQSVLYAEVTEPVALTSSSSSTDFEWTTPWIVIVAGGGAGLLAILLLLYLLFTARRHRRRQQADNLVSLKPSGSDDTTPIMGASSDEKDGIMRVRTVDEAQNDNDVSSDGTSVYSYKQHDDSGSVSLAPSFLHAITEHQALGAYYDATDPTVDPNDDDDSIKAPSLLWSQQAAAAAGIPEPDESVTSEQRAALLKQQQKKKSQPRHPQSIKFYPTGQIKSSSSPRTTTTTAVPPASPSRQDASWIGSSLAGDDYDYDDDNATDVASSVTDAIHDVSTDVALMDFSIIAGDGTVVGEDDDTGVAESFVDEEDIHDDDYTQSGLVDDDDYTVQNVGVVDDDDDLSYLTQTNNATSSVLVQQQQQGDDDTTTTQTTTTEAQPNVFKKLWSNGGGDDSSAKAYETDFEGGGSDKNNDTGDLSVNLAFDSVSIPDDASEIV